MSGHSKWATIKRSKAVVDQKRGKMFTKVAKEIIQAASIGGGNPEMNARLRTAIQAAKAVNMPSDNIKKAIMKGTGELAGETLEDITYEGYGPGGVAVMVETTTDNKNRTASEIRSIFTRYGSLGEPGSVSWMFQKKGQIVVKKSAISEDELMGLALDAGADDIAAEDDSFTVTTSPGDLEKVYNAIKTKVEPESSEVEMIPQNYIAVEDPKTAEQVLKFMDVIDDQDDVQKVYSNFDIPEELMEKLRGA